MRARFFLLGLALVGCAADRPASWTDAAWPGLSSGPDRAMPPPPFDLVALPDEGFPGGRSVLEARLPVQAPDGVKVTFVYSDGTGAPICPQVIAPDCLDITGDFQLLGSADTVGDVATVEWFLPQPWDAPNVYVQAVVRSGGRNFLSEVEVIDVLRPRWDVDGDGRSDFVLAAPREDLGNTVDAGFVSVHVSRNLQPGPEWVALDQSSNDLGTIAEAGDGFGGVVASGDFDGDRFDDILVGWPLEDNGVRFDAGWLAVQYGGPTPGPTAWWDGNSPELGGASETNDLLGAALAVADLDHDDFDDAVIGMPGDTVDGAIGSGSVHILYGGPGGLGSGGSWSASQLELRGFYAEAGDHYGLALATGDFDVDGHVDLAIGGPLESTPGTDGHGAVAIVFGTPTGPDPATAVWVDAGSLGFARNAGANFGASLAAGDLNNDGRDVLVIGAPGAEVDGVAQAGKIYAVVWDGAEFEGVELHQGTLGAPGSLPEEGDRFGTTLEVARYWYDGDVLLVGTPFEDLAGMADVGIVEQVSRRVGSTFFDSNRNATRLTAETYDGRLVAGARFGTTIVAADLRVSVVEPQDWIIGAPGDTCANGVSNGGVLYPSAGGAGGGVPIDQSTVGRVCEFGDGLGDRYLHPY